MKEVIRHPEEEFGQFPWDHLKVVLEGRKRHPQTTVGFPVSYSIDFEKICLTYVKPLPNPTYEEHIHMWLMPYGLRDLLEAAKLRGEKNIQDGMKRFLGIIT